MEVEECQHPKHKVVDSRKTEESIWRRRECLTCRARWNTYEVSEEYIADLLSQISKQEEE